MSQSSPARARFGLLLDGLSLLVLCGAIGLFFTTRRDSARPVPTLPAAPVRDSSFSALGVSDEQGQSSLLRPSPGGRGLLLLVFKSDCPACGIQKAEWVRLARRARERAVEVVALTLEPLSPPVREYFGGAGIPVRRIADPGPGLSILQTTVVPATILITDQGRIAFHAIGLLDGARTSLLETLL